MVKVFCKSVIFSTLLFTFFSCSDSTTNSDNNANPSATFIVTPTSGNTSTLFIFDANGCADNEDATELLSVRWDWENDGNWDTNYSTAKQTSHQYNFAGTKVIKLEVTDTGGLVGRTTKQISVEVEVGTAPVAVIEFAPTNGFFSNVV